MGAPEDGACAPSGPERKPHGRPRSPSSAAACEGGEVTEAPRGRQPHLVLFGLDFCADLGDRLSGQRESSTRRKKKKDKRDFRQAHFRGGQGANDLNYTHSLSKFLLSIKVNCSGAVRPGP